MTTEARIIADSVSPGGDRLTTFRLRFPRFILSEFNTHRALSRNAASSRAIPVLKLIERVERDPFIPTVFPAERRGMSAGDPLDGRNAELAREIWVDAMEDAVRNARLLATGFVHKSYVNRLLEPFSYVDVIASATEWANFFGLRCAPDAQPEFRELALLMLAAYREHEPRDLAWSEWHVPFGERMEGLDIDEETQRKVAVARIARLSYTTHDGAIDVAADVALFMRLLKDGHMSPFEHIACASAYETNASNFRGWDQLRLRLPVHDIRTWADVNALVP